MTIYWLLFAFPAIMALAYPVRPALVRYGIGPAQGIAFLAFVLLFVLISALRFETGGDWLTYGWMFEDIEKQSLGFALSYTDPLFGLLNWVSAQLGTGVFFVNGVVALFLVYGVVRASMAMREPWLAVLISVPYLLIVVGLGYIRQGAAIGLVLAAIAALDRGKPAQTIVNLLLAVGFHSSAIVMVPLFILATTRRNKVLAFLIALLGTYLFLTVLLPQLGQLEQGYIESEYDSGGALIRLLMGLLPAILVLLRWRHFVAGAVVRPIWLGVTVVNFVLIAMLLLSPSSTAVDRIGLYFSMIQLAAFGEIRDLLGMSERMTLFVRIVLIGIAAAVQSVWLIFATHAEFWVPYRSIFDSL